MKMYNNGQRKSMAYGSMVRKPMNMGGMAEMSAPQKKGNMTGMPMMAGGGKLKMVEKDGKKVPFFAADGKGKMAYGGQMKKMGHGGQMKKMGHGGKVHTK
jgi:hypothetical protein